MEIVKGKLEMLTPMELLSNCTEHIYHGEITRTSAIVCPDGVHYILNYKDKMIDIAFSREQFIWLLDETIKQLNSLISEDLPNL